jgi:transcriptional regulator with PAS, ATPase and Fis domain
MALPGSPAVAPEEHDDPADAVSLKAISKKRTGEVERDIILKALVENKWNKKKTAEALNVSYRSLQYKVKEYGIDR